MNSDKMNNINGNGMNNTNSSNINSNINNNNINGNMGNERKNNGFGNEGNQENNVRFFLHKCPNCSAPIKVKYGMTSVTCDYCSYTSLIAPSEMEQMQSSQIAKSSSRKSNVILMTVMTPLMIVFLLSMISAFGSGYTTSGVIALIQCICIVSGMAFGLGKKVQNIRVGLLVVLVLLSFVLVVPFFSIMFHEDEEKEQKAREEAYNAELVTLDSSWPDSGIGEVVPKPDLDEIQIWDNTKEGLSLRAKSISEEFYKDYKDECIKSGFTECVKEYGNSYESYTTEGYYISVLLTDEDEFYLTAKAPIEMKKYLWPESGVGSLLPEPDNEYGNIVEDRNRSFEAKIYNVTEEDFENYIQACKDAGFTENVSQTQAGFNADDKDGNSISLYLFTDFYSTMRIAVEAQDEEE